jgi:hypothetical protein
MKILLLVVFFALAVPATSSAAEAEGIDVSSMVRSSKDSRWPEILGQLSKGAQEELASSSTKTAPLTINSVGVLFWQVGHLGGPEIVEEVVVAISCKERPQSIFLMHGIRDPYSPDADLAGWRFGGSALSETYGHLKDVEEISKDTAKVSHLITAWIERRILSLHGEAKFGTALINRVLFASDWEAVTSSAPSDEDLTRLGIRRKGE